MAIDWFSFYAPLYEPFMRLVGVAPVAHILDAAALSASDEVLDLGGGTGRVARAAAKLSKRVVVLDPSRGMLKRVGAQPNVTAVMGRAQALPFVDASFDVVLCVEALHHIKDAEMALREVARVVRPGGRIVIHEFDVRGPWGFFVKWFEWLWVDRSRFFTPAALAQLCADAGLVGHIKRRNRLEYSWIGRRP